MLPRESLETIPIEGGIRFHPWTVIGRRNQRVSLQRDGMKVACERLPIDVDRNVRMNVKGALFQLITGNAIYGRIGRVRRCVALGNNEIGDASDSQHDGSNDTEDGNALHTSRATSLCFTPLQFLPASFLPHALPCALLTHGSYSPFKQALQDCYCIT